MTSQKAAWTGSLVRRREFLLSRFTLVVLNARTDDMFRLNFQNERFLTLTLTDTDTGYGIWRLNLEV